MFLPSYTGTPIWWYKILFHQWCVATNLHMIPLSLLMIAPVLVHEHSISFLTYHLNPHPISWCWFPFFSFLFLLWNSNFLYSEMFIRNRTKNNHDWTECIVTCSHRFYKICVPLFPTYIIYARIFSSYPRETNNFFITTSVPNVSFSKFRF